MEFDLRKERFTFKHSKDIFSSAKEGIQQDHNHTEYELIYILSGNAVFKFKGVSYNLRANSLQIIAPGRFHHIEVAPKLPYERIVIRFPESGVSDLIRKKLPNLSPIYTSISKELSDFILNLDFIFEKLSGKLQFNSFIDSLNILLALLCEENQKEENRYLSDERLNTVLSYIDEHLLEIETASDIYGNLYMSKTSLTSLFAKGLGTSPMQYVKTQRIMLANTMIINGSKAYDAAIASGFNDYSSFFRNYIKIFGHSPRNL